MQNSAGKSLRKWDTSKHELGSLTHTKQGWQLKWCFNMYKLSLGFNKSIKRVQVICNLTLKLKAGHWKQFCSVKEKEIQSTGYHRIMFKLYICPHIATSTLFTLWQAFLVILNTYLLYNTFYQEALPVILAKRSFIIVSNLQNGKNK